MKGIVCPNHGEELEGLPFPLTEKGTGICPVSRCSFDYEVELDDTATVVDKFGKATKKKNWKVSGDEES